MLHISKNVHKLEQFCFVSNYVEKSGSLEELVNKTFQSLQCTLTRVMFFFIKNACNNKAT